MPSTIRVHVLDDDPLARNALRILLSTARDLRLVAEISELQHFPAHCLALQPQVALIGGRLKPFVFDIPALTDELSPQTKIIALLKPTDPVRAQALLATNLAGCLFRPEIDENLLHAIRAVAQGGTWFSRAVVERLLAEPANPITLAWSDTKLTQRDQRLLALLGQGADNRQMAADLRINPQTVRNYVSRLCKKLGVTRTQLVRQLQPHQDNEPTLHTRKLEYKQSTA
jgi:DNA-binding NarL/FixJ family response regulator